MKHKTLTYIILAVILLFAVTWGAVWYFLDAAMPDREYLSDISVPLADSNGEIIIKEWRFLLGSGAEIYYRCDGKMKLLGETTGGDDGYCPFAHGEYTVSLEEEALLVRWHFRDGIWREKRFSLPQM